MFVWKVIAKMLGHIIIKTTQRYDKILDTKINRRNEFFLFILMTFKAI